MPAPGQREVLVPDLCLCVDDQPCPRLSGAHAGEGSGTIQDRIRGIGFGGHNTDFGAPYLKVPDTIGEVTD
jgi:hypothetical protein